MLRYGAGATQGAIREQADVVTDQKERCSPYHPEVIDSSDPNSIAGRFGSAGPKYTLLQWLEPIT